MLKDEARLSRIQGPNEGLRPGNAGASWRNGMEVETALAAFALRTARSLARRCPPRSPSLASPRPLATPAAQAAPTGRLCHCLPYFLGP